jgi:hypothetical protein
VHANILDKYPRDAKYEQESYDPSLDIEELEDMPNRIFWRPICDNDDPIDNQLKYILIEQEILETKMLTTKELGLLKGIRAAASFLNNKELELSTSKIIEAIENFGALQLFCKDEF